jgi:hypothetical protein
MISELGDILHHYIQQFAFIKQQPTGDGINIWKKIDRIVNLLIPIVNITYKDKTNSIDRKLSNIAKKVQRLESKRLEEYPGDYRFQALYQFIDQDLAFTRHEIQHHIQVKTRQDTQ